MMVLTKSASKFLNFLYLIQLIDHHHQRTVREDLSKCIKSFVKKCGTPLHREVADLITDQVTNSVARFCDQKNPNRKGK